MQLTLSSMMSSQVQNTLLRDRSSVHESCCIRFREDPAESVPSLRPEDHRRRRVATPTRLIRYAATTSARRTERTAQSAPADRLSSSQRLVTPYPSKDSPPTKCAIGLPHLVVQQATPLAC